MKNKLLQRALDFSKETATKRVALGFGFLVLLFTVFGYFVLPAIIKSQAEQFISGKLHRQMTVEKIKVSPYAMEINIHGLKIMEPDGKAVFASFEDLKVDLSSSSVFRMAPMVQEVRLNRPYFHLVRADASHYNIDDIVQLIASQPPSPDDKPARFAVMNIQVEGGRIEFEDRPEQANHKVEDLKLGIPFISSLPSQINIFVEPLLSAKVNGAPLLFKGKALPLADTREAQLNLDLEGVDVPNYLKYLPFEPNFKLSGSKLDIHLNASFRQPHNKAMALLLKGNLALKSVEVSDLAGKSVLRLPELAVQLGEISVFDGKIGIQKVALNGLVLNVDKDKNGTLNVSRLLPTAKSAAEPKAAATEKGVKSPGIQLSVEEFLVKDASLKFADEQTALPMQATAEKFDLSLQKIALDVQKREMRIGEVSSDSANLVLLQGKPGAVAPKKADAARDKGEAPGFVVNVAKVALANWSAQIEDRSRARPTITLVAPLSLNLADISTQAGQKSALEVQAKVNKTGQLAIKGKVGLSPLHADLALDIQEVDIMPLQVYFTDQVNLLVTRANLSTKGAVQLDQGSDGALKGGFKGDLALGNLAAVDKASTNDFLRWKSLAFAGVNAQLSPFSLNVEHVVLSDYFARVILSPEGRINLQDIMRSQAGGAKSLTDEASVASTPATPKPAATKSMPPVSIKKLVLQGGKVRFTDNFIKPNYTANLAALGGMVSGLSSNAKSMATVDLHGQVNNAPLKIAGKVNPLKGELALDIKAEVKSMELAPLSPYSGKYVGYGIEKGKLSFEVAYKVEDRKLTAENRLILDQLTFGERVEGSTAGNLPVHLAVALLRDRNGVIDINLPIGGSLDDPQFSVGGLIVRVIVNLIGKALTAPFALIGSLFGGGEELSWLEFDAGRAAITQAQEAKLKTLAKALTERPAVKLEITGRADPETDREGLRRASIDRKVRALKLKDMVGRGESAELDSVVVKPEEYPALLTRVYKDEKFTKPRNLIGMQKTLPVEEMEKLMLTNAQISDDDLTNLANRRAQAAKNWLVKTGRVPEERIYIVAGKGSAASSENAKAKPNRADFSLK
ncbi:MAG: hypothetical protein H6R18_1651 [Proteobacteria bacterium]|nr:hypothetical protein [Pseudomonadota bacterium]